MITHSLSASARLKEKVGAQPNPARKNTGENTQKNPAGGPPELILSLTFMALRHV